MKKRLLTTLAALLIGALAVSGRVPEAGPSAPPGVDSIGERGAEAVASATGDGIAYYLDDYDNVGEPLNRFAAGRGTYCCDAGSNCSSARCAADGLLSATFDESVRHGESGASLKLSYDVAQEGTLASYYEKTASGTTFHDLSDMDVFTFMVRGEGSTIGPGTRFALRFADKDWNQAYHEVVGVTNEWVTKTITLSSTSGIDWTQMNEVTVIFDHNHMGSGRTTYPLSGALYLDDLRFVDLDAHTDDDEAFLDLLQRRAFRFFWEYADPNTGLIRDRATNPDVSSIASVGFGLTAISIADQRGWIAHEQARDRVLATLRSFDPASPVVSGTHGLFWHFVDARDGTPMRWDGVSTIDTALLMAGVLTCREHFTETEITTLATDIYEAAQWDWFYDRPCAGLICGRWRDDSGFEMCWGGYNEAMILYLLAIGSPTHAIPASAWDAWAASYRWGVYYGYPVLTCPALFTHQYSHAWVDFRDVRDGYANYFQNSVYATLANRAYARDVLYPDGDLWGLTACDGPPTGTCSDKTYRSDIGYPPDAGGNDGTVAPTAPAGSIPFTPQLSIATLRTMYERYPKKLWGLYGLKDSLKATCDPVWFDNDYIGIDLGTTIVMIENYRTGFVWDTFMRNAEIAQAMEDVGFAPDDTREPSCLFYREVEDYDTVSGLGIAIEVHSSAWDERTLQIGTDVGNAATFAVDLGCRNAVDVLFGIRYSDDVAGNTIDVYLDGARKGSFETDRFGGWDDFDWDDETVNLGPVSSGQHTLRLQVAEGGGGSYGVNLDVFRLYTPLDVHKAIAPTVARAGQMLTYTLSVTSTDALTHTALITDILPGRVTPGGTITWTPQIAPYGAWSATVTVTVEAGGTQPLTNLLQVATDRGVAGWASATVQPPRVHLPVTLRNAAK